MVFQSIYLTKVYHLRNWSQSSLISALHNFCGNCSKREEEGGDSTGARPTNDILFEFGIYITFLVLWFKMCSTDHNAV